MNIKLRDYQTPVAEDVWASLMQKPTVLAASPGSGKTEISLSIVERYLREVNPNAKILVLTHGTNMLKDQFLDRIEHKTELSAIEFMKGSDLQPGVVTVGLPHLISRKLNTLDQVDLLIIDEAHEFFFGTEPKTVTMVRQIKDMVRPKHELFLTGTPAPFILFNQLNDAPYNIVFCSMASLIEQDQSEQFIHKPMIDLATSANAIDSGDYNSQFEIKNSASMNYEDTLLDVKTIMERVLDKLQSHFRLSPDLYNVTKSFPVSFKSIDKTVIACRNTEHSKLVCQALKELGIKHVSSNYDTDADSKQIKVFEIDDSVSVLVLVKRGVLGYNNHDIVNFIDMTGTRNPGRLYQMISRVVRPHPKQKRKLFFKIVSPLSASVDERAIVAALCLMHDQWLKVFNGKNFNNLPTLTLKDIPGVDLHNEDKQNDNNQGKKRLANVKAEPGMYMSIPDPYAVLKYTYNKATLALNTKAFISLGQAVETLKKHIADDALAQEIIKSAQSVEFKYQLGWLKAYPQYRPFLNGSLKTTVYNIFKAKQVKKIVGRPKFEPDPYKIELAKSTAKTFKEVCNIIGTSPRTFRRDNFKELRLEIEAALKKNNGKSLQRIIRVRAPQ